MKLTAAQNNLLKELEAGPQNVDASYKPAIKLAELGLAAWEHGRFGSTFIWITDAGRQALKGGDHG